MIARSRSAMSSPLPLVVKLNSRLPHVDVSVRISTTRASSPRGRSDWRGARFEGGDASRGTAYANRTPNASDASPGTTNAIRHPKYLTVRPVTTAAAAMPRLPTRPFTADHFAWPRRVLHQHRNADRVIDRRERAHERQRGGELPGILRGRGEQARCADAEQEHQHHRAAAPVVAQASRRHRAQPEQQEGAGRERHQVFPAGKAEVGGDRADRRREDQQHQVVDRVRDVQQHRRQAGMSGGRRGVRIERGVGGGGRRHRDGSRVAAGSPDAAATLPAGGAAGTAAGTPVAGPTRARATRPEARGRWIYVYVNVI